MHKHVIALSALALLATAPAFANQQLAQQKNCMSCHAVDKKIVGPAYKDVAAKYKNDPKAEAMLVQKVMKGGPVSGVRCRCRPTTSAKPMPRRW